MRSSIPENHGSRKSAHDHARYWTAILAASMCGANTGDFVSRILGLGHTRGLLPLGLIFLAILWVERRSRVTTEAYYWLAIIVLRTAATNLADLGTHDLKLGYFLCMGLLVALMVAMMLMDQVRGVEPSWNRRARWTLAFAASDGHQLLDHDAWPLALSGLRPEIGSPRKLRSAWATVRWCSSSFFS